MVTIIVGVACFVAGALVGMERIKGWIVYIKEKIGGKTDNAT
jgi:uncharacterized membrane protein (DUF4010 family)